ncbi:MAG: flavodoxin family protein [Sphaerochaetaceae bacterium]|jgi:multimeric flavodoxin WrbA
MRYLALEASPNPNGASSKLAKAFCDGLASKGDSFEILRLADMKIEFCTGCLACNKNGNCIQEDDMTRILAPKTVEADAIVLVGPVYWWGIGSIMKLYIDRFYAIGKKAFAGKSLYAIFVGAEGVEGIQYKLIKSQLEQICKYLKIDFKGFLPVQEAKLESGLENARALAL